VKLYNEPSPLETRVISKRFGTQNSWRVDTYLATGGMQAFKKACEMTQDQIIDEVKASSLRGRGGAGFPTGMKWSFVPRQSELPKYIVVNADESEPGTCKDRLLMEHDPIQMVEGILIAAKAVGASKGWVYIRGEYRYLIDHMDAVLKECYERNLLGKNILGTGFDFDLYTQTGAGAYECGEESALLESLEGKRGVPRIRPPFPAVSGAFQCPTVLNNVETFSTVPAILNGGGKWYADLGTPRNGGTRLVCLAGHVNKPGVYEVPLGMNMMYFLNEIGGGMLGGRKLKAIIPGGSSCPILSAEECDVAMDYDTMAKAGTMLGSGGMMVMDETTDMVKVALRIMRFYNHESCGWCIPCREGTTWLRKMLARIVDGNGAARDVDLIGDLAQSMLGRTFCPLGDAAALPTISLIKKWRPEFEAYVAKNPFASTELVQVA